MLVLVTSIACEPAPTTPTVARTATPLDPATTGVIEGRVSFDGTPPAARPIPVSSDPTCAAVHPGGIKTNIANDAKHGAGADRAAAERERAIFNAAARTSPEDAAERIVRGVARNEERILIGADAWAIDRIQRWAPVRYWRLMGKVVEMLAK